MTARLRLVFMGTPEFAVPSLNALIAAGHDLVCVYSQPPRPAGRGQAARKSPLQVAAEDARIEVRCPATFKHQPERDAFAALAADAACVAAYGLILPKPVLDAPRLGCYNVHASILPRWRGAAPIQRAILAGDTETGISIMRMDEGLDTGAVLAVERTPIGPDATAGELHDRLAAMGADLLVQALADVAAGTAVLHPQPESGATYAEKISRADTRIDWTRPADAVLRQIRALSPRPGAWTERDGERLRVLTADPEDGDGAPGHALDARLLIACGSGALRLTRLQRAGRKAMGAEELLRGLAVPAGTGLD